MNKNDLRYIKTEELIISSFIDCVNTNSFEQTTVSMICERARISRHSFYTHYTDKYALLDKLYQELEEKFNQSIDDNILLDTKMKNFYPACHRAVNDFIKNKDLIIPLLKCSRHRVMEIYERIYIDVPTALFIDQYEQKMKNPKLQLTKKFLLNGLLGYLEDYLLYYSKIDKESFVNHLYRLCNESSTTFINQLSDN